MIKNIAAYFGQFLPAVEKQIQLVKSSIETELNEFVAIQRWKDINFYARKEATTKIRRQLFKFVKKLREKLVDKSAEELFFLPSDQLESTVRGVCPRADYAERAVAAENLKNSKLDKLQRAENIYKKSILLNQKIFENTNAFGARFDEEIFEFSNDIKERFEQLAKDTGAIPEGGDKEKRISAVKSLLTKKRRALFDLFSALKSTGLSFKRGLTLSRDAGMINKWFQGGVYIIKSKKLEKISRDKVALFE